MGCREPELSILIADDREIRLLNRRWLGRDRATNVLAFPQGGPGSVLGDVVVSAEACVRRARRRGDDAEKELRRALVHGILHLVGHDHVASARGRAEMLAREDEILALLAGQSPEPMLVPAPARNAARARARSPRAAGRGSRPTA